MHRIPQDPGILGFLTTREYLSDHIRACLALPASAYPALGQDETQATEETQAKKKSRLHRIFPQSAKILKHVEAKKKSGLQGGSHTVPLYTHPCINIHIRA